MSDIISFGLQVQRSYNIWINREFPNGNIPPELADFVSLSSSVLKLVTEAAAYYSEQQTGGSSAMIAAMQPLVNTLAGISLAGNITAD